jgi:hypothetical protein
MNRFNDVKVDLVLPVARTLDLSLFEEQDRAERHYRKLYPVLQDASTGNGRVILEPVSQADEFICSLDDNVRAMLAALATEIRNQGNRSASGVDQTHDRLVGMTLMDEIREKADRLFAVHANIALTGRALADAALVSAWALFGACTVDPVERLRRTMVTLHDYHQARRTEWLGRLRVITGVTDPGILEAADVGWDSPVWSASEWRISNLPSGWDAALDSGDAE